MAADRATWVQIVRVPEAGVSDFQRYEDIVLPLLPAHEGRLEERYRDAEGTFEVHVVSFPGDAELAAYRADSRRQEVAHLLAGSGAVAELVQVSRVTDNDAARMQ